MSALVPDVASRLCPLCREPDADAEEEATPWKEQENWESHQIRAASMKTGAKDRKAKQNQYDFVFDDAIGFVQDQMLAGGRLCCINHASAVSEAAAVKTFLIATT